jgi:hypothetical protein
LIGDRAKTVGGIGRVERVGTAHGSLGASEVSVSEDGILEGTRGSHDAVAIVEERRARVGVLGLGIFITDGEAKDATCMVTEWAGIVAVLGGIMGFESNEHLGSLVGTESDSR